MLLRVTLDIPESKLAEWEWVEDGKPYREWRIPAEVINRRGVVSRVEDDQVPYIRVRAMTGQSKVPAPELEIGGRASGSIGRER